MASLKKVGTTGSVNGIEITVNNVKEVLESLDDVTEKVLTMIGIKIEKYAKAKCPVGKGEWVDKNGKKHVIKGYRGGTLRNSITFVVEGDELSVGSNVEYAPYVELGTGPYFESPPAWIEYTTERGNGEGSGYVKPRPFLKPAITDHIDEYIRIIKNEMKNA